MRTEPQSNPLCDEESPAGMTGEAVLLGSDRLGRKFRGHQLMQEIRGPLRLGGCGKDGPTIRLENLEPMRKVRGVILAGLGCDTEIGAKKG
jgi:hypothetical protein